MRRTVLFAAALSLAGTAFGCKSARTGALPEIPTWQKRPSWAMAVTTRRQLTVDRDTIGED